ncbi:hypothetical protein DICPUDRAFT_155255 [Dictyostelium purpureum]|uniref:Trafficking protein particle complex subunit 11 domain-containing protein n=1 Tax=Dictyostelium purpureum TaxID=5786 RepID=F0ZTH3_DICPU|nr:uncharacterized protein DICPUDRAFT_155255 [Dictyostelium purpureum]EGC32760.1 hypothetical protein DICPUDRAFT_155255 [Dictyostelium purpureum]|eukprot:XP_003290723.1 hypothetical protein DICPUDRAFT_155255 [Dictyostelium purpureum]
MNELPDDLILTPQPLIGLVGCQNLHFYIDKNISLKPSLDFERIHTPSTNSPTITATSSPTPITPNLSTANPTGGSGLISGGGSYSSSPIDPYSVNNTTFQLSDLTIQSDDIWKTPTKGNPLLTATVNSGSPSNGSNSSLSNLVQQQSLLTPGQPQQLQNPSIQPVIVGGWRVQYNNLPIFKVSTFEPGSLSTKKDKKLESYIPMGILKANWIHKHKASIPSVISLFIQWPEDKNPKSHDQILAQIDLVKGNIKSRNIKLMVVIVTSVNLDNHDEKVVLVRRRADVDPKYFLFLNKQDLKPFVRKWERLALELSDQYYKDLCQTIRSQITRTIHPFLAIRYHFKIAYYSEFRNDIPSTLKFYKDSYSLLKDYKINNDNKGIRFAEVRNLASFFNFKICKISLWNNLIHESLQQFEKHSKLYRIYMGPGEKEFTHSIWLAREYQIFAELLEMCPNTNKSTFITNPGFYYQISAKHLSSRRENFKALSDHFKTSPKVLKFRDSKQRYDLTNLHYIGQPPPDLSHPLELQSGNTETHDELVIAADEDDFNKSVAAELSLNYTTLIIDQLNKAYDQSTVSGNHRILSYIESQIAYEYFTSKQYDLALKYYSKNAFTYRREKWTTLLTHSLSMLLKSVHLLNLPTNFIGYALDYLSPELNNTPSDRSNIQKNIQSILYEPNKLSPPLSLSAPLDINMDHTHPLINCRVQFPQSFTFTHSTTEFYVVIGSHFPNPIGFSSLKVLFSEKSYNKTLTDNNSSVANKGQYSVSNIQKDKERSDLIFLPDESRLFSFKLNTKEKMELECLSVILEMGEGNSKINFIWNVQDWAIKSDETENEELTNIQPTPNNSNNKSNNNNVTTVNENEKPDPYKKFLERSSIRILDHESLIQIKCNHNSPAIVNEFYEIELEIVNNDKEIKKGSITFEINQQNQFEKGIYLSPDRTQPLSQLDLERILEKKSFKKKFYIYSSAVDENKLLINISYETKTGEISHTSKMFIIPVQIGFNTQFQFFNDHFQLISDLYDTGVPTREQLLLLCDIRSNLPYNVIIEKTSLQISSFAESARNSSLLSPNLTLTDETIANMPVAELNSNSNNTITSVELSKDNNHSSWFNLVPLLISESISFGNFVIEWKRKGANVNQISILPIALPHVRTTSNSFITNVEVAQFGVVGVPFIQTITIQNNTHFLQEFELVVINSPSYGNSDMPFFFSGDKQSSFSIHPDSTHEIKHVLLPLVAGKLILPHFKIISKRFNKELAKTKNVNSFIFIKPNLEWISQNQ